MTTFIPNNLNPNITVRNTYCRVCDSTEHREITCQVAINSVNNIFDNILKIRTTEVRVTQDYDPLKTYLNSLNHTHLLILTRKLNLSSYIDNLITRDIMDNDERMYSSTKLIIVTAILWFCVFDKYTPNTVAFSANIDDMFYQDNLLIPQNSTELYPRQWDEYFPTTDIIVENLSKQSNEIEPYLIFTKKEKDTKFDCPICIESLDHTDKCVLNCKHVLCNSCLTQYLLHNNNNKPNLCSLCRTPIRTISFECDQFHDEFKNLFINNNKY